jgi:hypothetical protein
MSDLIYEKAQPVALRDVGLDERWLQDQIEEDPLILGLVDLAVLQRERKQPTGDPDWFVAVSGLLLPLEPLRAGTIPPCGDGSCLS